MVVLLAILVLGIIACGSAVGWRLAEAALRDARRAVCHIVLISEQTSRNVDMWLLRRMAPGMESVEFNVPRAIRETLARN